jgi:hypothetical protein
MAYALRGGLSYCVTGDRLVFLDLPSDRYFCLAPSIEADFRDLAEGRTPGSPPSQLLHSGNLLIRDAMASDIAPCVAPAITREIRGEPDKPTALEGLAAIGCILRSRARLRACGLAATIQHLAHRKASMKIAGPASPNDQERVLSRVAGSFHMAARTINTHGQCLPWSLAIAHRLISLEISPLLVLGVRLTPFAAHAWVQVGQTLISEHRERTDVFTPILVV